MFHDSNKRDKEIELEREREREIMAIWKIPLEAKHTPWGLIFD